MHMIPMKMSKINKVIVFIILSTLLGLNTKMIDIIKPQYSIEQKINEVLTLNDADVLYNEPFFQDQ